ncbi:hypothetical protein D3C81_1982450 [compost metagenome]
MLNQQNLQAFLISGSVEQKVQVPTHCQDFLILSNACLVFPALWVVRPADLIEYEKGRYRCVDFPEVLLQSEGQRDVESQVVFIRSSIG